MSEWHPLKFLLKLVPASDDPVEPGGELTMSDLGLAAEPVKPVPVPVPVPATAVSAPEAPVSAPEGPPAVVGGMVNLSLPKLADAVGDPATVVVRVPKAKPQTQRAEPAILSGASTIEPQPLTAFSTAVDLVKLAQDSMASTRVEDSDPFTDAAVVHRVGTNDRWVLSTPAEQGEVDFGRLAWGFHDPENPGPGPLMLSFDTAMDFLKGCAAAKGDSDDEGFRISAEIADATGPSPHGSTFIRDALQCKRKMALRYEFGLIPKIGTESPWLTAGTVVHRALAYYWANQMDNPPSWHQPDPRALEAELLKLAPTNPDLVRDSLTIMFEYERYYATGGVLPATSRRRQTRQDREWKVFSVEEVYSCTIDDIDPPNDIDRQVALGLRLPPTTLEMAMGKFKVTIRPDIVVSPFARPDRLILVDHKTEGDDWTGGYKKTKMKVWEGDDKYSTHFQFFMYLHVLQFIFGKDRVQRQPVVQRVRRTSPFQMHRHEVLTDARRLFDGVPAVMRKAAAESVIATQQAQKTIFIDSSSLPCYAPFPCQFIPICESPDDATAAAIIAGRFCRVPV